MSTGWLSTALLLTTLGSTCARPATTQVRRTKSPPSLQWKVSVACGRWFHLSFEHFDVISMIHKNTNHGKCLSICFLFVFFTRTVTVLTSFFVSQKEKKKLRHLHFTSMVGLSRPISAQEIVQLLEE